MRVKSLSNWHYKETHADVVKKDRQNAKEDREAEKIAEEGNEFICRTCRKWYSRKEFEYVWDGETKLATNCESCRYKNRIRYMNPNKKRKK
tara:strand:- start:130 stop:402 length:273 start_codon:yes stop_codon:yes gene_type:complete